MDTPARPRCSFLRWLALSWLCFASVTVHGTPYAAAVTNIAGLVTFTLNEPADKITIYLHGVGQLDLGPSPLPPAEYRFAVGLARSYEIVVEKSSGVGWRHGAIQQLGADTESVMQFEHQRGLAVNRNPGSPNFGRIYVSMGLPGTHTALPEGIYVLPPNRTSRLEGLTAGLDFALPTNNALSPFRLTVGPGDFLYICDFSDATGNLYVTGPDVSGGAHVFGLGLGGPFPITTNRIRGSIAAVCVEGSSAHTNLALWVVDEDRQANRQDATQSQRNSIWFWNLQGEALPASNTVPVRLPASPLAGFAPQYADLARGPDGKLYVSQSRRPNFGSPGATTPGLYVLSPDGSATLWDSLNASRLVLQNPSATDILTESGAIDISQDGQYIAILRTNNSSLHVLPLVNGLPDLTNRILLATTPAIGPAEDIAFDAANNLYYVSSGQRLLRILCPGGYSKAITRSDGTFSVVHADVAIVAISAFNNNVIIDFTFSAGGPAEEFTVESTPALDPTTWATEYDATIVANGPAFRAEIPMAGDTRFYRIRR